MGSPIETSNSDSSQTTMAKKSRKKTVTFKSILETSDDISIKKVYNPSGAPLVPIIKKESLIRSTECIVKPSRLTEVVKQSSFNNLNRIKTLGFHTTDDRDEEDDEEHATDTGDSAVGVSIAIKSGEEDDTKDETEEEGEGGNVAMGDKRFILPKRSLHSRRVIKPNKKFLDDMDGCSAKAMKRVNAGNKGKALMKTESQEEGHVLAAAPTLEAKVKNKSVAFQEQKDNFATASASQSMEGTDKEETNKVVAKLFGQPITSVGTNLNLTPFGSNKVILRQPRLQFAMPLTTTSSTSSLSSSSCLFGSPTNESTMDNGTLLSTSTNLPNKNSSLNSTGENNIMYYQRSFTN